VTAGRRRPELDFGRRPRPHFALWGAICLVIAVVIGEVTADVVNSGARSAEMTAKSYAAGVVPIIEESTALRLWLADVREHAVRLGRLGVETALGRLVSGSRNLELQLANLGIPPPSPLAARLLSDVLARRATAARLVLGGVALAVGPSRDVPGATAILVRAGAAMAGSDGDYARFLSSLPPYVRRSVSLPFSRWDSPPEWTTTALAGFAAQLARSPSLLIHRSLVIVAISLEPPALRIVGLPARGGSATSGSSSPGSSTSTTTTTSTILPGGVTTSSLGVTTTTTTSTTSTTSTTTTTLQVPPAGSVSCLQPTNQVTVDVVVANAGNVAATHVEVSAMLNALALPQSGGTARRRKRASGGTHRAPLSCEPGQGSPSGGASGGTGAGGASTASGGRTVRHDIALLPAGSSDYVAMPAIPVSGGGTYVLTVRLGGRRESVTLQVAPG
jgi:hypothetical protein